MTTFLKTKILNCIQNFTCIRQEEATIIKFLQSLGATSESRVLEVGCGFGKKMHLLRSHGLNVIGVDINAAMIRNNVENGLNCMTVEQFSVNEELFDIILLSHVIEHFMPKDLVLFLDNYLDRLREGGHLIIATPLLTPYFYEDFDHVKPYHPTSIQMVFGVETRQIQYISRNKLDMVNIWFRRAPFKLIFTPYLNNNFYIPDILNIIFACLFRASFGLLSRKTGWVGLYCKVCKKTQ